MKNVAYGTGVSVTSALGAFVSESINEIAIWLVVMFCVVVVDLLMKCYKIIKKRDERFRWTKGMRDTMGKMATYFAFVVTSVFVQHAANIEGLAKTCILVIIAGEAMSITGNYCKAHGYSFNENALLSWIASKFSAPKGIIEKEND